MSLGLLEKGMDVRGRLDEPLLTPDTSPGFVDKVGGWHSGIAWLLLSVAPIGSCEASKQVPLAAWITVGFAPRKGVSKSNPHSMSKLRTSQQVLTPISNKRKGQTV